MYVHTDTCTQTDEQKQILRTLNRALYVQRHSLDTP